MLTQRPLNRPSVWVNSRDLSFLTDEAEKAHPLETGGVFIGYWRKDGLDAVITHVLGPGPAAVHTTDRFEPDTPYHVAEVARIYRESGHISTYLGDWHTHPESEARLSALDRRTLREIAADPGARAPRALMGVLAGASAWNLTVWVHSPWFTFLNWPCRPRSVQLQMY